jgi:hypothetical protein
MKIITSILAVLLFASISVAQENKDEPRHIDFTKELIGFDGKPLTNPPAKPDGKPEPITLSEIAVAALETSLQDDRGMAPEEKFKLDLLARKIYKNKDCVLTNPEITQIEERIGKMPWPSNTIVGASWRILDPARAKALEKP